MRSWIFDQYVYWSQAIKHAYTWTRDLFFDFAVLLAVFIYNDVRIFRDSGRSIANEVSLQTFWSSIYPTGLAFFMLFLFRLLIIAPFRIAQERQLQIVALSDILRKYEDRQAAKLHFVFSHLPPYEIIERDTVDHRVWRFRVGVKNVWQERLHQCCVKLDAISPRGERFLSRNLKLATDNPGDVLNIPHKQAFPLNPDEQELIDVVLVHQRTNGPVQAEICYALEGVRDLQFPVDIVKQSQINVEEYLLTLKAVCDMGRSASETYVVELSADAPRFRPLHEVIQRTA